MSLAAVSSSAGDGVLGCVATEPGAGKVGAGPAGLPARLQAAAPQWRAGLQQRVAAAKTDYGAHASYDKDQAVLLIVFESSVSPVAAQISFDCATITF